MANQMLLDDTRALRREQREARIARRRERRQARDFKRRRDLTPPLMAPLAPASTTTTTADEPAAELPAIAAPEPQTTAVLAPAVKLAAEPQPAAPGPIADERELEPPRPAERGERSSRRERDVAEFLARVGDCFDNALAESFIDSYKTELIADRVWCTNAQLELATVRYVGWFNHRRLHSSIGNRPPVEHEREYWARVALGFEPFPAQAAPTVATDLRDVLTVASPTGGSEQLH